jgi:hypothetical protein
VRDRIGAVLAYGLTLFNLWIWAQALIRIAEIIHASTTR